MPKRLLISLPVPLIEDLDREAKVRDLTRSCVIRERLESHKWEKKETKEKDYKRVRVRYPFRQDKTKEDDVIAFMD